MIARHLLSVFTVCFLLIVVSRQVIDGWIGIHCQDTLTQESLIRMLQVYLCQLSLQVLLKHGFVGSIIMPCMVAATGQHVKCQIVAGIEPLVGMYLLIHVIGYLVINLSFGCIGAYCLEPLVYTWCTMIVHMALIAHNACLHAYQIVLL